jgi:CO/xanthine dehydrogenase Mo-binding subunit
MERGGGMGNGINNEKGRYRPLMENVYIVQSNGSRRRRRSRRRRQEQNKKDRVVIASRAMKLGPWRSEGRRLTRLETGLRVGPRWGGRGIGDRGHRQAFVRVTAAAATACGLLLAPREVFL